MPSARVNSYVTVAADDGDNEEIDTRLFAGATPVFAVEQVDGWTLPTIVGRIALGLKAWAI